MKRRSFLLAGAVTTAAMMSGCKREEVKEFAIAKKRKITIKLATSWPAHFPIMGEGVEEFAKRVEQASDGEVQIKVFAKNLLVPALQVFDACSAGQIEAFHSGPYYWKGKNSAFSLFGGFPFGFTSTEMNAWMNYGNGLHLWRELYAKYNLYPLLGGNTDVQMGGWFRKEIHTLKDLKGLKMRIPGLGGEVMAKLGINPILLPAGEIFTALDRGTIDATEWVGPALDMKMGFYKVAKYYYSGFHEPGSVLELTFNKKFWESLPKDIHHLIDSLAQELNAKMIYRFQHENAKALTKLKSLGVELKSWPQEIVDAAKKALMLVIHEQSQKSEDFQRVWKDIEPYWMQNRDWTSLGLKRYLEMRDG
ncbi:TRAP transporter substrate-binding protein [Nitratiruptor sp. SB155-2]|uniref:TRAP transporter substrate-binding protein n=1 Tax=Nitratiruptor sp. (strain SB155-2) TaxID=387092 RepID=UPI00015873DF|nr:TRAP transporter substrate-binding protein DctP [Nitratiruptor sp. SB155-2]BAF69903.1 C4-dicarboxylate transporter, substrate-binding protein [Nitratiruptor sp. SB155-2]